MHSVPASCPIVFHYTFAIQKNTYMLLRWFHYISYQYILKKYLKKKSLGKFLLAVQFKKRTNLSHVFQISLKCLHPVPNSEEIITLVSEIKLPDKRTYVHDVTYTDRFLCGQGTYTKIIRFYSYNVFRLQIVFTDVSHCYIYRFVAKCSFAPSSQSLQFWNISSGSCAVHFPNTFSQRQQSVTFNIIQALRGREWLWDERCTTRRSLCQSKCTILLQSFPI